MKTYQILYRNASGGTSLTRDLNCRSEDEAIAATTDFVRANFIEIYIVGPINYGF